MSETESARLHIACGSYDGTVFAMSYGIGSSDISEPSRLKAEFIDPEAHTGPVTALTVCGDTVASGSGDEAIQLFSISQHHRMGCLELHTGKICELIFADTRHLFSTGEDSCIAIWRCTGSCKITQSAHKWQCIRQMRRHKAPITAMALHPSNRLAFSLSDSEGDHTLRIWSLARGRLAYTTRLRSLNAEGASHLSVLKEGSLHLLLILVATPRFHRLHALDLGHAAQKAIFSVRFPTHLSVPPIVLHVDENHIYLLAPIGNCLRAYRCSLNGSNMEVVAESRIQGKRFKFLKALPWSEKRKLVVMVTSDADGSYVRGYILDLEVVKEKTEEKEAVCSLGLNIVFTYDVPGIRITKADAAWNSVSDEDLEEKALRDVEMHGDGDESEEESEDVSMEEDEDRNHEDEDSYEEAES